MKTHKSVSNQKFVATQENGIGIAADSQRASEMTQGQKVAQGQISAREKAHETAEVEEGLVEEDQGPK